MIWQDFGLKVDVGKECPFLLKCRSKITNQFKASRSTLATFPFNVKAVIDCWNPISDQIKLIESVIVVENSITVMK